MKRGSRNGGGREVRLLVGILVALGFLLPLSAAAQGGGTGKIAIALHGGAGTITPSAMTPENEQAYRAKLTEALRAGYQVLQDGGASLDAVVAAIHLLEDSPLFNAGKGAVFTSEGTVELDAAIMDGRTHQAGAVSGLQHVKSPISLARLVMEASPHVMLVGAGAEAFAREHGVTLVDNAYFRTKRRQEELERVKQEEREDSSNGKDALKGSLRREASPAEHKFGTVGVVALDRSGNLAAGTSTGGLTNKRFGRVGDSPIIGAGTYADDATCAVSATGHGEYFIRAVVAYDIAAMMKYGGKSLREAADAVIMDKLTAAGGDGGVVALDRDGNVAMPFNTPGMYRAAIDGEGNEVVEIYKK